jgi:hypothetical protein
MWSKSIQSRRTDDRHHRNDDGRRINPRGFAADASASAAWLANQSKLDSSDKRFEFTRRCHLKTSQSL